MTGRFSANKIRVCRKCHKSFDNTSTGSTLTTCQPCHLEVVNRTLEKSRRYYHEHKEEISIKQKEKYENNPEPRREYQRNRIQWIRENEPEQYQDILAQKREYNVKRKGGNVKARPNARLQPTLKTNKEAMKQVVGRKITRVDV